jgi:hypothetical protein
VANGSILSDRLELVSMPPDSVEASRETAGQETTTGSSGSGSSRCDPSPAIAAKLGFVQTGEQCGTEDGLELVFELEA